MTEKLSLLIQAENPLISIESIDEERAFSIVLEAAEELNRPVLDWSLATGLCPVDDRTLGAPIVKPGHSLPPLEHLTQSRSKRTIFVLRDLGPHCKDARVHRQLREAIHACEHSRNTLVLIDALPLPDELRQFVVRFEIGWPTAAELKKAVRRTYRKVSKRSYMDVKHELTNRDFEQMVQTLRGLTVSQAERVVASAIYDDYALSAEDLPRIIESKRTLLGSMGCLESIAADFSVDDIGGLRNLKAWLKQRRRGFTANAREFGIEPPRGVLMLGVPGCGKSLCAKVVAADWRMPLLRLDPGVLYQKYIGESESQLRQAILQAESMAPVILWIDEIEKAFASATAGSADGGLSKRMFGTLLSWMQDHRHPIFIVATANDISALPPELMRKGRFDEVFFVDLPTTAARARILGIHIKRRHRSPKDFDLTRLAKAAEGFSGSELEEVVKAGLFGAFAASQELADEHILAEIEKTRPLSVLNAERIAELREWAANRCVSAD